MRRRKSTKRRRQIVLILKGCISLIIFHIMFSFLTLKNASPIPLPPANETIKETPQKFKKIPLNGLSQAEIPTGCESVSTIAVLQHYGVNITADDFINNFLPCKDFYKVDSKVYGANPHEYFAGNPYETASLGCYPSVILKALNEMKNTHYPGTNHLYFENTSGFGLNTLITQYIDKQIPVILWVTIHMREPYDGMKYYLEDGTLYTWTAEEHCTVLCGYDKDSYYLMDPLRDGEVIAYPKHLVEQRYNELGKYSIVILPSS